MIQDSRAVPSAGLSDPPTVLIVDDDPGVQTMMQRMLRAHGFRALTASNSAEAVVIAEHSVVNGFILDITLGENESGLDMLPWLRRHRRYSMTPTFILTGKVDVSEDEQTQIRRHRAYLFYKGQSLQLLMDYLKRLLVDPNPD
jgi:DNA-binding response OmpR family regulator